MLDSDGVLVGVHEVGTVRHQGRVEDDHVRKGRRHQPAASFQSRASAGIEVIRRIASGNVVTPRSRT
jgi:hypothetical protein